MLERTQVYVDTSYLLASFYNSWETGARAQLEIDLPEVVAVLGSMINNQLDQPIHRQLWYDGIPDSGPHRYQRALRTCDGVLLRAGQLIEWGERRTQKAVDTRLVVDMVLASVRQQCSDIVLVSGDADMIPGVQEATNAGIRVHLYGFGWDSMSSALRHACDTTTILDPREDFADCMQLQVLEGPLPPTVRAKPIGDAEPLDDTGPTTVPDTAFPRGPVTAKDKAVAEGPESAGGGEDASGETTPSSTVAPSPNTEDPTPPAASPDTGSYPAKPVTPANLAAATPPTPANLPDAPEIDPGHVVPTEQNPAQAPATPTSRSERSPHSPEEAVADCAPSDPNVPTAPAAPSERDIPTSSISTTPPAPERKSPVEAEAEKVPKPSGPPKPSMMAPRRKLRSRYVPLPNEVWASSGSQTPYDVGQQYASWWYENAATGEQRDQAHLLSGGGLPPEIDRPLLQFACETLHEYTLSETQRVSLRDGFHSGIRGVLLNFFRED